MLAGARAFHGDGALDDALADPRRFGHVLRVVAVDQHDEVKIAVADVAEEGDRNMNLGDVVVGRGDALGEA